MNHPALRDGALFFLRLVIGVILIAHGWQKVFIIGMNGPQGTVATFQQLNIPQPRTSAWLSASFEMLGGALLIVGLLTTAVAVLVAMFMAAVMYVVHLKEGFFIADGGFEFVLLIVAAASVLVVFGPGRVSLDKALSRF